MNRSANKALRKRDLATRRNDNGVVQTCINCARDLTIHDMRIDKSRCKKNGWEEPTGFACQKSACKEFRASVSGYQAEENADPDENVFSRDGQRRLEDGTVRGEAPLQDVFMATKHELGEVSNKREPGEIAIPAREERTDQEIHRDVRNSSVILLPRCRKHGTPGCKPCKINDELETHYDAHPEERTSNGLPKAAPKEPWANMAGVPRQPSLEEEVATRLEQKSLAKLAKRPPKKSVEVRREKQQRWVRKAYDNYSLRRLHGYTQRQLAALFDMPRFNPRKTPVFTPGQAAFYRDYAQGKMSKKVLEERVRDGWYGRKGFERADYLKRVEDDLVNRAWFVGLLEMTPVRIPGAENDDDPHAPATDVEEKVIGRGGSTLSIISGKYKSSPGKTFNTYPVYSFDQGSITKRVSGGGSGDDSAAERGSDYGESSDDEA